MLNASDAASGASLVRDGHAAKVKCALDSVEAIRTGQAGLHDAAGKLRLQLNAFSADDSTASLCSEVAELLDLEEQQFKGVETAAPFITKSLNQIVSDNSSTLAQTQG
jgi:hypothetical protein